MLVLTRKSEEKIVIGNRNNKVEITVLKVQGGVVSLGFKADPEIPIHRAELLAEIEAANTGGAINKDGADIKGLAKKLNLNRALNKSPKQAPTQT